MHRRSDPVTSAEWVRIKAIVAGALGAPVADRPAYLTEHCGSDSATRLEVESLLASAVAAEDLYKDPSLLIDGEPAELSGAFEDLAGVSGLLSDTDPASRSIQTDRFLGTPRYAVLRQIGAGGMGVVYEVEDRLRHQVVALKTLRRWSAADIYRLKREFRSLADIAHPHLASLHDLVVDDEHCFFTMELVDGVNIVDYARAGGALDGDRARRALLQLVEGVEDLHRHGKLHCDIKPSNVLVTREGRVVILDFGLTASLTGNSAAAEGVLTGTPAYLAPEQCDGQAPTQASDWYAVGATLYHALTGRPPFQGTVFGVIRDKMHADPDEAASLAPGVPADLNAICTALLSRDIQARPSGRQLIARLRDRPSPVDSLEPSTEAPFVGRQAYLDVLRGALAAVKEGRTVPVYLHGPSGIGKSALVQCFFERGLAGEPVVALRSRCHEHELVPYKGLDGVIDGLSRHLGALPEEDAAALLPREAFALARLFPVMQIAAAGATRALEREPDDPVALRRRAFVALKELLGRIAARRPLVVEIDDFQWADADSAATLTELLRPPNSPPMLLIVSFRTDEMEAKPFLRALVDQTDAASKIALALGPLSEAEVAQLIDRLLPAAAARGERRDIAREAAGNPYLVEELTRYAALGLDATRGVSLDEMLRQRLASLPAGSRAFVETLAVCGRPIQAARVFDACGLSGDERPLVARLRGAHFLRSSRSAERVEMYHDRIRETIAAGVAPEAVRRIHEAMAHTLVAHGDDEPEELFEHYRAAGRAAQAAVQAAEAAHRASRVLAFDRAAGFYRAALDLQPDSADRVRWTAGLARSLESAGRPPQAADAYLSAAGQVEGIQRVEWLRKGAEQLLMAGHIDRGLDIIHSVLPSVGMRLTRGPRAAVGSILLRRAQLAWRGLAFTERDEARISKADLLRIDTCWAIATGLMLVDTPSAAAFNLKELLVALDAGEPYRIARALALEASFSAAAGGQAAMERSTAFVKRARALAERVHHPHVVALSLMTAGLASFLQGQWRTATDLCDQALTMLRDQCTGVLWESTLAQNFYLGSLLFRGQFKYVCGVVPALLQAARERGNLYFTTELTTRMTLVWLARDTADEGERQAGEAMANWSDSGFHRQHYNHFMARAQTALYRGQGDEAWRVVTDHWPIIRRNMWLHVQYNRIETAFVRARSAIAMAAGGRDIGRMCDVASADARRLTKEKMFWSDAIAALVRGTVAHLRGDQAAAETELSDAVERFDRAEMRLYAAATRRRVAQLVGGDRGRRLRSESDAFMAEQEIRNPAAMTRLIAPGFED